jgi:hypothetical protein
LKPKFETNWKQQLKALKKKQIVKYRGSKVKRLKTGMAEKHDPKK